MAGIKRRVETSDDRGGKRTKVKDAPIKKSSSKTVQKPVQKSVKSKKSKKAESSDEEEEEDGFNFDDNSDISMSDDDEDIDEEEDNESETGADEDDEQPEKNGDKPAQNGTDAPPKNINASRESHAKQKALAQERKAAKPNADSVARSKKLWERLRRKSHVPLEERKKLVAELFSIIKGRVKEFVFKHDSVRVVQTALKYANVEQRKVIARELKGDYRSLAESKYAKFLVAKLLVHGDNEIRDLIVPEFYGHVKRLMRHPEASWILDDIYRTVATSEQRAHLLSEWYGPEFAIFRSNDGVKTTSDLSQILATNPEKRGPIMNFLRELINLLVQKKTTGFTMLHDAMLQYFLNTKPGSTEATELIELLKGDEEGDLVKNLAFTKSGARLMALALAYSNAKDRKLLLRFYRDTVKMMAGDLNGHVVLLAAYEVVDDTKLTQKTIFPELLNQGDSAEDRNDELLAQVNDLTARVPILFLFTDDKIKWLVPSGDQEILDEIRQIRTETSKKDPETRRQELVKAASPTLLEFIAARAESLVETSFGCQLIAEVLFSADGDKTAALAAVAAATKTKPEAVASPAAGRMLKALVQGGRFDPATRSVQKVEPALNFHAPLYSQIKDEVMSWATGANPFVIVALAESDDFEKRDELLKTLKKNKKALQEASEATVIVGEGKQKREKPGHASSAARILLEKIA